MRNTKDGGANGPRGRFMKWAKKMKGGESFYIFFGNIDNKGKEYPHYMKREFTKILRR